LAKERVDAIEELRARRLERERSTKRGQRARDIARRHRRFAGALRELEHEGIRDRALAERLTQHRRAPRRVAVLRETIDAIEPARDGLRRAFGRLAEPT